MKTIRLFTQAVACVAFAIQSSAQDPVRIESQRVGETRIPIAIPAFATTPEAAQFGRELAAVMASDLDFSGLFTIVPETQFPGTFRGFTPDPTSIDFESWRGSPAEHLVYAVISREGNSLVAECRLFDVLVSQQVVGKRLVTPNEKWSRLLAHQFADEVIRFLTGVEGIASTELVFSAGEAGHKEIYIADYDGSNVSRATDHNSISIKPKIGPDNRRIAYLSYKDRYPFLYVFHRDSGLSTPLSKRVGLNHAPAWAPDGNSIALCLSKDGNTEIYVKHPDGTDERRLTNDKGADTSPCFSPDGGRLAFVSDRAGRPQIFVMGTDGSNPQRVSFQGGNSYDPVWSPDGKYIAYVAEKPGEGLEIYVMNADGSDARRVTDSEGSNESPTFSPDSRHVAFGSTRTGTSQIFVVTLETGVVRRIPGLSNMRCEGPSWGPRRQ